MIGDQASTVTKTYTYLLLIGIDAYHTGIPSLHNACRDARTIGELLCAKYQFEPKKTVSLFNDDATGRNILDTLTTFEHTLTSEDSLVIYFAGHGFYDTRKEVGYWLPADAQKDNTNSYLSFSVLRDYLKVIPSIHTVILADSCFAGALFMERDITYRQTGLERLAQYPSRYLLAAGRNEPVSDGAVGRHSPFAQSLIDILSYHKEPFLPITQLTLLLIEAVASNAKQLPRGEPLREVGHRGGVFLFRHKEYTFKPEQLVRHEPLSVEDAPNVEEVKKIFSSSKYLKQALFRHLSAGDIEHALALLDQHISTDSYYFNDILLLQARYNRLSESARQGIVMKEHESVSRNKIYFATLEYIKMLEEDDLELGPP